MKMITKRGIFLWILCFCFLFGLGFLTYSLVADGETWAMKSYNRHVYRGGQLIAAGQITDRDGVVLSETQDGKRVYNEDKNVRKSTLHLVGDTRGFISTGVQTKFEAELVGYNLIDGVYNINKYGGNDLKLTIDADINKTALKALGDKRGTVAVVNYKTGDIVTMVSTPTYDVNTGLTEKQLNSKDYEGVYINRFIRGLYTPGSTFKLVTAICALENMGDSVYDRTFECDKYYDVDGIKEDEIVCNSHHGKITFEEALAKSCNVAFAQLAIELGPEKLAATAKKLGLTSSVVIDEKLLTEKGIFKLTEGSADATVGWTGIGQGETLVSPAAMLRLMCAIANDGKAVPFNVVDDFTNQDGKSLGITYSKEETQLISTEIAGKMKALMRNNVKEQYGDSKYKGLSLCAKSGTAQIDKIDEHNTAWFVGFMDDAEHPYAFVVIAEEGNSGSKTAGPMANKVLQAIVEEDKK